MTAFSYNKFIRKLSQVNDCLLIVRILKASFFRQNVPDIIV